MKKVRFGRVLVVALASTVLLSVTSVSANSKQVNTVEEKAGLLEAHTLVGKQASGNTDGNVEVALLNNPTSVIQLQDNSLLISDTSNHKLRLFRDGKLTTYSGKIADVNEDNELIGSYGDGALEDALYQAPTGMTTDQYGNIYVSDTNNHSIRKITPNGEVTILAGSWKPGRSDGNGAEATFFYPSDVAVDSKGNVYVADTMNHLIRKIDTEGNVTTLNKASERVVQYELGELAFSGDYADGPLENAMFNEPSGLAIDSQDNLYVSDTGNQRIRYINVATKTVTTIAGGGSYDSSGLYVTGDYVDGSVSVARFDSPNGITVTASGAVLVADKLNHAIRVIENQEVSTLAGNGEFGITDGIAISNVLYEPTDVLELTNGEIAIVDSGNNSIKIVKLYASQSQSGHANDLQVYVQGQELQSDVPPFMYNNRIYVPLRAAGNALQLTVNSIPDSKQYELIASDELTYVFSLNEKGVTKSDHGVASKIEMDSELLIRDQRVFIPIRFIAQELGYDVQWDGLRKNAVIRSVHFE